MHRILSLALAFSALSCRKEEPVVVVVVEQDGDTGDSTTRDGLGDAGVLVDSVTWTVDWDTTGLTALEEGGWRLERSDGAALELHEGWLVVYALVLEPCETTTARTPPPHGYADHPSRTARPFALALHELTRTPLGAAAFGAQRFCETGVTIFRGESGDPGMPEDGRLDGLSFWMTGALRTAPDAPWEPFEMASHLSAEHDLPLVGATEGAADVEVVFSPAHLLDDLSLDLESDRLALGAIANLTETATATLSNGP